MSIKQWRRKIVIPLLAANVNLDFTVTIVPSKPLAQAIIVMVKVPVKKDCASVSQDGLGKHVTEQVHVLCTVKWNVLGMVNVL